MRNYIPKDIPRATWNYISATIAGYETMKSTYTEQVNSILQSSPSPPDLGSHRRSSNTSDTTGDKAVRLTDPFMARLLEKIIAVETVYLKMTDREKQFTQEYFWEGRRYLDCEIVNSRGEYVSEITLKRLRRKIVFLVGTELKEI